MHRKAPESGGGEVLLKDALQTDFEKSSAVL